MSAIKEGGVTQNESLLPKFLHKKRIRPWAPLNASIFFSLGIFSKIRSPSCFILVTRNPPFVFIQKFLYSGLLQTILYRSFIVNSLYVLIGKFRFFQFSKSEFIYEISYYLWQTFHLLQL